MIEIQDVSKQFDCVTALRHLTLKVQDGSVFGLVGSNGAGKSTLLRILAGVYRPDSGRVLINGQAPFENEQVKRSTVFISDYPYLAPTATVRLRSKSACRLPVKTDGQIPKYMMEEAMRLLDKVEVTAPVHVGDVVVDNIFRTGVHFVATKTVEE